MSSQHVSYFVPDYHRGSGLVGKYRKYSGVYKDGSSWKNERVGDGRVDQKISVRWQAICLAEVVSNLRDMLYNLSKVEQVNAEMLAGSLGSTTSFWLAKRKALAIISPILPSISGEKTVYRLRS